MREFQDVTFDEVKAAALEVVKDNPNFIYTPPVPRGTVSLCAYTGPDDCPSCVVGHIMDKLELKRPRWNDYRNTTSVGGVFGAASKLSSNDAVKSLEFLRHLQILQDRGHTWITAFRLASDAIDRNWDGLTYKPTEVQVDA